MKNVIVIDTETTGVDFENSQIIQLAVIFLDSEFKTVGRKSWNINYDESKFAWNEESAKIHAIEKEASKSHGLAPEIFLQEFEKEVIKHYGVDISTGLYAMAANAYFDILMFSLLHKTYKKLPQKIFSYRTIDLTSIACFLIGARSFGDALRILEIETDGELLHNAEYDAELHLKVFYKLMEVTKSGKTVFN